MSIPLRCLLALSDRPRAPSSLVASDNRFCGVQLGLHRFFDGLPGPLRPGLRLTHQYLVGYLLDALTLAHGALLFLAETHSQDEYNPAQRVRTLSGNCPPSFRTGVLARLGSGLCAILGLGRSVRCAEE